MDTFGWNIDSAQNSTFVVDTLDMAPGSRRASAGGIVHLNHGVQVNTLNHIEVLLIL
jgi:hypothetical protein